jgi:very-short-patch-repair endonuclease
MLEQVDLVARQQHGILTHPQAVALLGADRCARWLRSGRLVQAQPRAYRMIGAPPSWHLQLSAAVLSSGGVASHRAAAELWGLVDPEGFVEVSIHPTHHARLHPPAIVHRIKDLRVERAVRRCGIDVTDPQRTLLDLGLVARPAEVGRAVTIAIANKLVGFEELIGLREALGRPGRNGSGVLGRILDERAPTIEGEQSVLEAKLVDVLRRFGLPLPTLQHEVWVGDRLVARVDGAYIDQKIAIELDGYRFHGSPEAFQYDRIRQNRLVELGWTVLRFTWQDLVHHPDRVAQTIRRLCTEKGA